MSILNHNNRKFIDALLSKSTADISQAWNFERINCTAVILTLFYTFICFMPDNQTPIFLPWFAVTAAFNASVFFITLNKRLMKNLLPSTATVIITGYWLFVSITAVPLFLSDAEKFSVPVIMVCLYAVLIVLPILPVRETIVIFALPIITAIISGIVKKPEISYYAEALLVSAGAYFLAFYVNNRNMFIIETLKNSSDTDMLTGLKNRASGLLQSSYLYDICRREKLCMGLYLIEIDKFREFCAERGRISGDAAICRIANEIKTTFMRKPDINFRISGAAFGVCVIVSNKDVFYEMAERLRTSIENESIGTSPGNSRNLTVSIGCVCFDPETSDSNNSFTDYLKEADAALDRAKKSGMNKTFIGET